jgi:lipoprotein signal peptidase
MIWSLFSTFLFIIDFKIKTKIEHMPNNVFPFNICSDKITIHKSHNKGLAFNFLENSRFSTLFIPISVLLNLLTRFTILLSRKGNILKKFSFSLILSGGLGNIYDRIAYGYVVDYFSFNFKSKYLDKIKCIIFNLSDIFIFVGTILLIVSEFNTSKKNK